ncbi:MAG: malonic semialdehyde reductase [Pseudomonadota bacterium]
MPGALGADALATLFSGARSQNGWLDTPLPEGTAEKLYELTKWGPTSGNCLPGRFVFIETEEGKERLRPALSKGNLDKTMAAPMTVIVAHDRAFVDKLPELFPHGDARPWFKGIEDQTAFRNGSLQGAYLMMAARALGLDCGPMSGFDAAAIDAEFFADTDWTVNFLVNIGYGDPSKVWGRLPRLAFDDACMKV